MNNDNDIIEILDDIESENNLNKTPTTNYNTSNINDSESVKYDPISNSKEEIKIEETSESEKSKSGLGFVIALFIIIGAFIVALPYIAKLFR